jgi:hypothetical protein
MLQREKRPFCTRKREVTKDKYGDKTPGYGQATAHMGNIQPVTDTTVLEAYGAIENRLYAIFMPDLEGVEKLDGVCWQAGPDADPDFEVADVIPWRRHVKLMIRKRV